MAKSRYAKTRSHRKGKKAASRRRRHRGGATQLTPAQQECANAYLTSDRSKMAYSKLNRCMAGLSDDPMGQCQKEYRAGGSDYSMVCGKYLNIV
jgi:hypothetical protein